MQNGKSNVEKTGDDLKTFVDTVAPIVLAPVAVGAAALHATAAVGEVAVDAAVAAPRAATEAAVVATQVSVAAATIAVNKTVEVASNAGSSLVFFGTKGAKFIGDATTDTIGAFGDLMSDVSNLGKKSTNSNSNKQ